MKRNYQIGVYLDTRRAKSNKKYPVKIRVFCSEPRKQVLYSTKFDFTEDEFNSIWYADKPGRKNKDIKNELTAIEVRAIQVADSLTVFNFDDFERLFIGKGTGKKDVNFYYEKTVEQYKSNGQIATASNYSLSLKSLQKYAGKDQISFTTITPKWLKGYEKIMIETENKSQTTVGIYLRPLRAIFNTAIAEKTISADIYPFGRRKYVIPAPKASKRALSKDQMKKLWEALPDIPEQQKAKDYWFFSYACNGMNMKDILNLKYKNITDEILMFTRAKTANTNREQTAVKIFLTDYTKEVIEKYGTQPKHPNNYVFPILKEESTPEEKHRETLNFIRFVNQHFGNFAKKLGIDHVSTYYARHTFATNAIRSGFSMEAVSEALAHSNLQTTRNYFSGFTDESKKDLAESLFKF